MRVAMVLPGGVDPSGTHRVIPCLLWLIERVGRRHDLRVFPMRGAATEPYSLCGATILPVRATGRRTVPTVRALLREHRRDAFDLLHAFWASGPGVAAAIAGRLIRRPTLLHIAGGELTALPDIRYGGRLGVAGRLRVRLALAGARARTAPSTPLLDAARGLGYPADRLPLGVSRDAWPPRPPQPRDPTAPARLIHVGSLNRVKDQATLLRAARALADAGQPFTLDVVGTDTLDGAVQRLAVEMGIGDQVRFHGFLPQSRLRPLVEAADLMLVSSRHEAEPVAAAEAAMVGVPTVGTRVGLLSDWAPEAAAVVPTGDADALARAAMTLLRDDHQRRRIAAAAHERVRAEDADWTARQVLRAYRELIT